MATYKDASISTMVEEGGFNPKDSNGQPAAFGLNRQWNPEWSGWSIADSLNGKSPSEITRTLKSNPKIMNELHSIYQEKYFKPSGADRVKDKHLASALYDFSVNSDPSTAVEQSRVALGLNPKGGVDNDFITSLNSDKDAIRKITEGRKSYALSIKSFSSKQREQNIARASRVGLLPQERQDQALRSLEVDKQISEARDSAGLVDKFIASTAQAGKSTILFEGALVAAKSSIGLKDDVAWKQYVSKQENVEALMQSNGIGLEHITDIRNSTSKEHFQRLINVFNNEDRLSNTINNRIGETSQAVSSAVGILASPENLILPSAIPLRAAAKLAQISNITRKSVSASTVLLGDVDQVAMSVYAAQARGIKTVAMAQSAALGGAVIGVHKASNDFYGLDDAAFDAVLYSGIDMALVAKQINKGATGLIDDMNRFKSHVDGVKAKYAEDIANNTFTHLAKQEEIVNGIKSNIAQKTVDGIEIELRQLENEAEDSLQRYLSNPTIENETLLRDTRTRLQGLYQESEFANNVLKAGDKLAIDTFIESYGAKLDKIKVSKNALDELDIAKNIANDMARHTLSELEAVAIANKIDKTSDIKNFVKDGKSISKIKVNQDGSAIVKGANGSSFKIPAAIALGILFTQGIASASSGESSSSEWSPIAVMGAVVALYFGKTILFGKSDAIGMSKMDRVKEMYHSFKTNAVARTHGQNLDGVARAGEIIDNSLQQLRSGLNETLLPILRGDDQVAKDVAESLFHNADDGAKKNAEDLRTILADDSMRRFDNETFEVFEEAYKESVDGMTTYEKFANPNVGAATEAQLARESAFEVMHPNLTNNTRAKKIASSFSTVVAELWREAKESGVIISGTRKVKNYFPQMWKYDNARYLILSTGGKNGQVYKAIRDNLTSGYSATGLSGKELDDIVELKMSRMMNSEVRVVGGDFAEEFGDVSSRLKDRYEFDYREFKDFDVNINGSTYRMTVSDILETDMNIVLPQYVHELSGHIALAKANPRWTSYTVALDDALSVKDDATRKLLTNEIYSIIGKSQYDLTSTGAKIGAIGKNLSSGILLPLAVANTIPENLKLMMKTTKNGMGIKFALNQFTKAYHEFGYDSSFIQKMLEFHGTAPRQRIKRVSYREHYTPMHEVSNLQSGTLDHLQVASAKIRDNVFLYNQLGRMTDIDRAWATELNINILAQYLNGTKNINPLDLQVWGITNESKKILGNKLKLNNKGFVLAHDPVAEGWNALEKDEYRKIINNMNQTDIQMHTNGGTPHYTRSSSFGSAMSTLLGFPLQSVSTHAARDLKGMMSGRLESYASTMMWFAGGYATYHIKAAITGKTTTEEDAMAYAIKSMPLFSIAGIPSMFTNPVIPSTFQKVEDPAIQSYKMLMDMAN